jgi:transcription termination factor Rho
MKTIKALIFLITIVLLIASCGNVQKMIDSATKEANTKQSEADDNWEVLFDGTSTDNFRGYGQDTFPETGWEIAEDGSLHVIGSGKGEAGGRGGDIITKKKYGNFELSLEWKVSEAEIVAYFTWLRKWKVILFINPPPRCRYSIMKDILMHA